MPNQSTGTLNKRHAELLNLWMTLKASSADGLPSEENLLAALTEQQMEHLFLAKVTGDASAVYLYSGMRLDFELGQTLTGRMLQYTARQSEQENFQGILGDVIQLRLVYQNERCFENYVRKETMCIDELLLPLADHQGGVGFIIGTGIVFDRPKPLAAKYRAINV